MLVQAEADRPDAPTPHIQTAQSFLQEFQRSDMRSLLDEALLALDAADDVRAATDPSTSEVLGTVLQAPVIEEFAKGLGVLLLALLRRRHVDGPVDGVVYAMLVAAGFAFIPFEAQSQAGHGAFVGAHAGPALGELLIVFHQFIRSTRRHENLTEERFGGGPLPS